MDKQTFSFCINRLETAFMKRKISNETYKLYYEKLNHVHNRIFENAVDYCIDTYDFFPSISKINKATEIIEESQKPTIKSLSKEWLDENGY